MRTPSLRSGVHQDGYPLSDVPLNSVPGTSSEDTTPADVLRVPGGGQKGGPKKGPKKCPKKLEKLLVIFRGQKIKYPSEGSLTDENSVVLAAVDIYRGPLNLCVPHRYAQGSIKMDTPSPTFPQTRSPVPR